MRPDQQDDPETWCPKCHKFIRTANYLIHNARCKGSQMMQESRISQSRPSSRVFSSRQSYRNQRQVQQQEKIPCSFCGYMQTFAQLDTHPNQCQHREIQCQRCQEYFPLSLIQQHDVVCPARRNHQFQQQEDIQIPIFGRPQNHRRINNPMIEFVELMQGMSARRRPQPRRRQARGGLGMLIAMFMGQGEMNDGLEEEEIKKLPVMKYKKKEEDQLCTICYCNFQQGQDCMKLPCSHLYHPQCIQKWLQKNQKCPVCKQSVRGQEQQERREYGNPRGGGVHYRIHF